MEMAEERKGGGCGVDILVVLGGSVRSSLSLSLIAFLRFHHECQKSSAMDLYENEWISFVWLSDYLGTVSKMRKVCMYAVLLLAKAPFPAVKRQMDLKRDH
jgi:hypothetical protein